MFGVVNPRRLFFAVANNQFSPLDTLTIYEREYHNTLPFWTVLPFVIFSGEFSSLPLPPFGLTSRWDCSALVKELVLGHVRLLILVVWHSCPPYSRDMSDLTGSGEVDLLPQASPERADAVVWWHWHHPSQSSPAVARQGLASGSKLLQSRRG